MRLWKDMIKYVHTVSLLLRFSVVDCANAVSYCKCVRAHMYGLMCCRVRK